MKALHPENRYLDLVETAVNAYGEDGMLNYIQDTEKNGVQEHGFPRLTANLGLLVANGRLTEKKSLLERMMTLSCRDAAKGVMPPKSGGNEFSVKELALALVLLEKAGAFPEEVTSRWRQELTAVQAERCYSVLPKIGLNKASNWCVFGCASEQARLAYGLGGDPAHVEKYVSDQIRWFDENGMYRDPMQPIVYDMVTRLQFALILYWGYNGPSREQLESFMEKSAIPTLDMLSACGEIPYGGRSNQFLHNNTFYAALCEWYALRAAQQQNVDLSRRFRAAATRACDALTPWLKAVPIRHVKNLFPRNSSIGCEGYAYFDKYMVTMGSWAALGWLFCKDNPDDADGPLPKRPSQHRLFATSPDFHLIMASAGDYSIQFDYHSDERYDADGLGRIHRAGAPVALGLSCPCPPSPHYHLDQPNEGPLAIMPLADGVLTPVGGLSFLVGNLRWENELTSKGLCMVMRAPGQVSCSLPAFAFDGEKETVIQLRESSVSITYEGWECIYTAFNGVITDSGQTFTNRNGRYRRFIATGEDGLVVTVMILPLKNTPVR